MFNKIVEFFTGKKPEVAPEAPYKVEVTPVAETPPTPVTASVTDTVIITPDAVMPSLVSDTIVTEPVQPAAPTLKSAAKTTATSKAPRKPRSKKI